MHVSWPPLPRGQNVSMGNHEQIFGSVGKRLSMIELLTQNIWTVQLIFLGFFLLWERGILGLIKEASQVTIGSPPSSHGAPRQTLLIGNTWGLRILLNTKSKAATNNVPVFLVLEAGLSTGPPWCSPNSRHSFASLVSFTISLLSACQCIYLIDWHRFFLFNQKKKNSLFLRISIK